MDEQAFASILSFLRRVPAVQPIAHGSDEDGTWWVKFGIDVAHPLAWDVVQELAYVLNGLPLERGHPSMFRPFSPPTYLNGGPAEHLSWVIESHPRAFEPDSCTQWMAVRLPKPVDDPAQWPDRSPGRSSNGTP